MRLLQQGRNGTYNNASWKQVIMSLPEVDVKAVLMLLHRQLPFEVTGRSMPSSADGQADALIRHLAEVDHGDPSAVILLRAMLVYRVWTRLALMAHMESPETATACIGCFGGRCGAPLEPGLTASPTSYEARSCSRRSSPEPRRLSRFPSRTRRSPKWPWAGGGRGRSST
jgi:hypothetical protein